MLRRVALHAVELLAVHGLRAAEALHLVVVDGIVMSPLNERTERTMRSSPGGNMAETWPGRGSWRVADT